VRDTHTPLFFGLNFVTNVDYTSVYPGLSFLGTHYSRHIHSVPHDGRLNLGDRPRGRRNESSESPRENMRQRRSRRGRSWATYAGHFPVPMVALSGATNDNPTAGVCSSMSFCFRHMHARLLGIVPLCPGTKVGVATLCDIHLLARMPRCPSKNNKIRATRTMPRLIGQSGIFEVSN
jgi:hypothetical protein